MYACPPECMYVHHMHAGTHRTLDSEEVSDLLELTKLEFQEIVRDYMGAKNPIHVIC